ncbi:MAG: two-component regulator propeller domain-containing protein [Pyrinomonadaceae bacterium]
MSLSKILLLCILLSLSFVKAQAQYRFDHWTTDNGLPQNSVRRIVQTSDGYLWLTTLDGLVRFDGVRFTVFNKSNSKNLPGNRFVDLFAEADDTLWINIEEQGLVRYRNGKFSTFTMADGLPSNIVGQVFLKPDGNLYVPTLNGLARFDGTGFTVVSTRKELAQSRSLSAASGSFWEINKDSLSVLKNGQKSVFDLPAALKNKFSSDLDLNYWVRLFEDRQGVLWISTHRSNESRFSSNKLFKFADGKFAEIVAEEMPRSPINDIAQDRRGTLWFGTILDGACRLEQNKFNCFNSENKLTTNQTRTIFTDREGTLWLTSEDKGIYRVGEQIIVSLSTKEGLAEKNAYVVYEDRSGAIWIGCARRADQI